MLLQEVIKEILKPSVKRLINKEKKLKLNKIDTCYKFRKKCEISKKNFIKKLKLL